MRSIQSEIDYRKLFFVKVDAKRALLKVKIIVCSIGFTKEVVYLLNKYDLSHHFIDWYHTGFFLPYNE